MNLQAWGLNFPGQFFNMAPYLATMIVLIIISSNRLRIKLSAPASLTIPFFQGKIDIHLFLFILLLRIVERPLRKMLNKQLFLAGEVKMIRLLILTISILGISVGSANADPKKVGFIYIGPPGDHGWTYMHDVGRQYMESQLGDSVTSTYIENVPENADAVRAIRKLAASGHDLIFTTSFNYMDQTLEVANEFPDVKFEHATGYKRAENVYTIFS